MRVVLRPLLDEARLGQVARCDRAGQRRRAWFASYRKVMHAVPADGAGHPRRSSSASRVSSTASPKNKNWPATIKFVRATLYGGKLALRDDLAARHDRPPRGHRRYGVDTYAEPDEREAVGDGCAAPRRTELAASSSHKLPAGVVALRGRDQRRPGCVRHAVPSSRARSTSRSRSTGSPPRASSVKSHKLRRHLTPGVTASTPTAASPLVRAQPEGRDGDPAAGPAPPCGSATKMKRYFTAQYACVASPRPRCSSVHTLARPR